MLLLFARLNKRDTKASSPCSGTEKKSHFEDRSVSCDKLNALEFGGDLFNLVIEHEQTE